MSVRVSEIVEAGQTCPCCDDLCSWKADVCGGCGTALREQPRTAVATPAYGMREVGGYGIRGWRAHCEQCGYLGPLRTHTSSVRRDCQKHRCPGA